MMGCYVGRKMNSLTLTLLGSLQIKVNGEPIRGVASNKGRALLAYLAVEANRPHRRNVLAEIFWPDKPEGVARRSLKQALSNLRKSLGDREATSPFLLVDRAEVQFNSGSDHRIDTAAFTALIKESQNHSHQSFAACTPCADRLRQAAALYRGDFLEQFFLPDSAGFEEWAVVNREALQRQMSDALRTLIRCSTHHDDYSGACEFGYQLVALESWNEENHRELMRLLVLCGQRSAALMQYKICHRILTNELGVEPAQETIELYKQIRDEKYEQPVLQPPERRTKSKGPKKPQPFKLPAPAIVVILILVLSLGLLAGFLKLNAIQSAIDSIDPGAPQPIVLNETHTVAADIASAEAQIGAQSAANQTGIPQIEYQALITLHNETGGYNWKDSRGWLSNASPCSWFGITCSRGSVIELNFTDNNLSGQIPQEISLLANLKMLNLEFNQLNGNIPPELGGLKNLESLSLNGNSQLNGPLPPELGNLINLEYLDISGSLVSGSIPAELGSLINLTTLNLQDNQLSGPLPPELGNLAKLDDLGLNGNQYLSDPLPPELGRLSNLRLLDLTGNQFSGALPPELGNLSNLRFFSVRVNPLSGPLPMSLMNLNTQSFHYEDTYLCEPPDPAFQEWLNGIYDLLRTGVLCQSEGIVR